MRVLTMTILLDEIAVRLRGRPGSVRTPRVMTARTNFTFLIAGFLFISACAVRGPASPSAITAGESSSGIRVESIHPSVGGQMLDVRYRVMDKEKAGAALNRKTKLYLIDQATGTLLEVPNMPKIGKLRQLPEGAQDGRIYWMFFGNPGGRVKPGSRVTMVINEVRFEDIVVR